MTNELSETDIPPFPGKGITNDQRRANTEWMRERVRRAEQSGGGTVYLPAGEYDLSDAAS